MRSEIPTSSLRSRSRGRSPASFASARATRQASPMRTERLGDPGGAPAAPGARGAAPAVLAAVAAAGGKLGLGSPAALIGDWFGSRAVIAPQLRAAPVRRRDVFGVQATEVDGAAVGGGWIR